MNDPKIVNQDAPMNRPGAPIKLSSSGPTPTETAQTDTNTVAVQSNNNNNGSQYPTLLVNLPSRGELYPPDDPLSSGHVEMKYMTAKEEDILTTESYITNGVVLDKLFQSLIVSKINYDNMLIGDRDAIMIAARMYGYGEIYETTVINPSGKSQKVEINLKNIPHKEVDFGDHPKGVNRFEYTTSTNDKIVFKLLTTGDEKKIKEFVGKVKHGSDNRSTNITTRLYNMILSVNGNESRDYIRLFIERDFKALDSRNFRKYVASLQPGINMEIMVDDEDTGEPFRTQIALGLDFFWPDTGV